MSKAEVDVPAKGGFSFGLCRRNEMLMKKGLKPSSFLKTGTTIVGLVYKIETGDEDDESESSDSESNNTSIITTAAVLAVMYGLTNYQQLPDDCFRYDWREPFNLQKGWLLWAGIGLLGALASIALTGAIDRSNRRML